MEKKGWNKNDAILLGAVAFFLAAGLLGTYLLRAQTGAAVKITVDGQLYGTYSLKIDRAVDISVAGTKTNRLVIQNGKANMAKANCPDQICVHHKAISKNKEAIVCLPNKVVAEVVGGEETGLDSAT